MRTTYKDVYDRGYSRANGNKTIAWWHRQFSNNGEVVGEFLRTSHPERQFKKDFVDKIVNWIVN